MGNTTEAMLGQAIEKIGETLKELGVEANIDKAVARFKEEVSVVV